MKDEIKEILDRLDYNEWEVDLYKVPITWCELYNIRDYITNLQEEIERQSKAQVILDNQIANMQQNLWEEQELSELFKDKYEKMKENAEILSKGYSDLERRNEKAIEYIKSLCYIESRKEWFTYGDDLSPEHIVNILQEGDEDENTME